MDKRDQLINKHKNTNGLRGKINAKCAECIYDSFQPGNWRQQVEACTSPNCPLYEVRPVSKPKRLATKTQKACNGLPEILTA